MKKFAFIIPLALFVLLFYACTHKPFLQTAPKTHDTTTHITPVDTTHTTDTTQDVVDTSVCFQRDILPMLQSNCAISGCHNAASAHKGYVYTTYATIMAKGIIPGNINSSATYTYCLSGKMPKSPVPAFDSTKLSLLRRWIINGAHDDTDCIVNCDTTKFTFAATIVPLLSANCYSCHATSSAASVGGNIILDTYTGVLTQAQNGKLLGDLNHAQGYNYMPLGGTQLSECKITQVSKWIAAGAQNN